MAWQLNIGFRNDALNSESRDAFADAFGWSGSRDPRGGTKAAFRDYCIRTYIRDVVMGARVKADTEARASRIPSVDNAP